MSKPTTFEVGKTYSAIRGPIALTVTKNDGKTVEYTHARGPHKGNKGYKTLGDFGRFACHEIETPAT